MGKSPTWINSWMVFLCFSYGSYPFEHEKLDDLGQWNFPWLETSQGDLLGRFQWWLTEPRNHVFYREIIPSHGHKIQVSEIIIYPDRYGKSPIHLDDLPTVFIVIFHCQITRRCHSPYWNGKLLVNPMISHCIIISSFDNLSPSHSMPFFVC